MQNGLQHRASWVSVHTKQQDRQPVRPGCSVENLRKVSAGLTLYQQEAHHLTHTHSVFGFSGVIATALVSLSFNQRTSLTLKRPRADWLLEQQKRSVSADHN